MNRMTPEERFWSNADRTGNCWEWRLSRNWGGYGKVKFKGRPGSLAHRIAWEIAHGFNPGDRKVLHTCDNRACVNPAHLFLGTTADNNADKAMKGRCRNGWQTGHPNMQRSARPGEPRRKVNPADVPLMVGLRSEGLAQSQVGIVFGIRQATVSNILRGVALYAKASTR